MTDFLIIGRGLSAAVLMHELHQSGLSFNTIGLPNLSLSSRVAAGIWNPVVFKRMTAGWMAKEFTENMLPFYQACENKTGQKFVTPRSIIRPFNEGQEETLWSKRANDSLKDFLDPVIYRHDFPKGFIINRGFGLVKQSGNLEVANFIDATELFFKDQVHHARVVYSDIHIETEKVSWQKLTAKNILFCEGHLVQHNPWFNWAPLKPAKGEILHIDCPGIDPGLHIFNKDGFILKLKDTTFKVGATYAWDDFTDQPTELRRAELEEKVRQMTQLPFTVKAHLAGVRPSSLDRRPLIGPHPHYRHVWIFNGLGAKGVLMAPYFAKNFVHFYKQTAPLHPEADIKRYYDRYAQTQDQTHWST